MMVKSVLEGGTVTLVLSGCDGIDAANAAEVKRETFRLVGETPNVVVDLSEIEFVDSAGIGVLVSLFKRARKLGGRARFCGLTPGVRFTLERVQLDRILEISQAIDPPADF
jgi:anti-sigma B factor antagonist